MNSNIKSGEQPIASTSVSQYKNHLQEENDERNGRKATRPGPKEIQAIKNRSYTWWSGHNGKNDQVKKYDNPAN